MLSYNELILLKRSYTTMHCQDEDFFRQYRTLMQYKPEYIFEFGVGHGDWIKAMDEALDYDAYFIGVENFASAFLEEDYYGPLPSSPEELKDHIGMWNFKHYYTIWEALADFKCNAARIDMNIKNQKHVDLITNQAKVLFIDDCFKPDYKFRLEMALKSDMEVHWYGIDEACLVNEHQVDLNKDPFQQDSEAERQLLM